MEKYSFNKNTLAETLDIIVQGVYTKEDAENYVKEYLEAISNINTSKYTLKFDCINLKVTPTDVVPQLQGCFELYKKAEFKKVIAIISASNNLSAGVMKLQFNRLAKTVGLNNFEIVEK